MYARDIVGLHNVRNSQRKLLPVPKTPSLQLLTMFKDLWHACKATVTSKRSSSSATIDGAVFSRKRVTKVYFSLRIGHVRQRQLRSGILIASNRANINRICWDIRLYNVCCNGDKERDKIEKLHIRWIYTEILSLPRSTLFAVQVDSVALNPY